MAAKYKEVKLLGEGGFGKTFIVRDEDENEYVKKVLNPNSLKEDEFTDAKKEVDAMLKLEHPNIVKYIEMLTIGGKVAIILEYCSGGTLKQRIDKEKARKSSIPIETVRSWVQQMADGIEYIHRAHYIHRDLKPENIFLTSCADIKIGDFGISIDAMGRSKRVKGGFVGTLAYVAPEVFRDEEYNYRCDLWSFGVVIYELVRLKPPFLSEDAIMDCSFEPLEDSEDPDLKEAVTLLLNLDPRDRPRAGEIATIMSQGIGGKLMDIAFAIDYTGSMQSFINQAIESIESVISEISYTESCFARVAIVKYRDHPPQDKSFVTKVVDFTRDIEKIKTILAEDKAEGGGDTPEAVVDALHELTLLKWRPTCHKVAVLILDAPPHGVGFPKDAFPEQCPCGLDPVVVCRELGNLEVKLYVFGCEPGAIMESRDLLAGLAHITAGRYKALKDAKDLKVLAVASTIDAINAPTIEAEIRKMVKNMREECHRTGKQLDDDALVERVRLELQDKLYAMKTQTIAGKPVLRITYRGEQLSKCKSLKEMRENMATLDQDDTRGVVGVVNMTSERVKEYLAKISLV